MTQQELYMQRLDQQDKILAKLVEGQENILIGMATHRKEHEAVDPSIKELINILKGIRFLRATIIGLAAVAVAVVGGMTWLKAHAAEIVKAIGG